MNTVRQLKVTAVFDLGQSVMDIVTPDFKTEKEQLAVFTKAFYSAYDEIGLGTSRYTLKCNYVRNKK